ncbi:hypothetical protein SK128_007614 [Halocaridina rubra]|uniref:Uncharacterized protein n=1 Tax=Halocaridina rubra TaxID=373956 RepID=A0AAN9AE95_HALRR
MMQCSQVLKDDQQAIDWHRLAVHNDPKRLRRISQSSVAEIFNNMPLEDYRKCISELRNACTYIKIAFPVYMRTTLVNEVVTSQEIKEPNHAVSIILIQLLTDVTRFMLTAKIVNENYIQLEQAQCDFLLKELEGTDNFHMESILVKGVNLKEGYFRKILRKAPHLHSVHLSGELCSELLMYLEEHPRSLRFLQLDDAMVTDREVVRALVGSQYDFETLGNLMCEGTDVGRVTAIPHREISHLHVESHSVTPCGGMVLLHYLPKLQTIQYSPSVYDTLVFLDRIASVKSSFHLRKIELGNPSENSLISLNRFCPELNSLMIECYDPGLESFEKLANFLELKHLTLRFISEELILSAIKTVGSNLHELKIEFETAFSISVSTIQEIQDKCTQLRKLHLQHVHIEMRPGDVLSTNRKVSLTKIVQLKLSKSIIRSSLLERLLVGNNCIETLHLDINKEALTDEVLETVLRLNSLEKLTSVYIGSGLLSTKAITTLMTLKGITKLSFDLQQFPSLQSDSVKALEKDVIEGNYRCVLESNVTY